MSNLIEKVAKAIWSEVTIVPDIAEIMAQAAITVVLKETKLECVKQSHGPCVCGFVDKIAHENGIKI